MALNTNKKMELDKQLQEQHYQDVLNLERARIDQKNRYGGLARYMNLNRREIADYRKYFGENQSVNNLKDEQDAVTLEKKTRNKEKHEEMKQLLLRQQLRENCPELRELESKLRCAYVTKELAAQIAEKKVAKLNEKIRERRECEEFEEACIRQKEYLHNVAQEDLIKKAKYKQELQDQMIYKEKMKRFLYEEYLREKKMIDDIVQRIYEEDQQIIEEKMLQMKRTREEMIKFKEAQDIWKKRKRDELEKENIKMQQYLLSKESDLKARLEEKQRKEAMKEEIAQKISKEMYDKKKAEMEREEVLQNLLEEEKRDEEERKHREAIERQLRQRLEVRQSLDVQVEERQRKLRREAEEDMKYKEDLMARMAEDQRLEQLSAEKKRLKMMQLRKDVEDMMTARRQKRAEEMQIMMKLLEQEELELKERQRIVEEERIQMLKEHANNLMGFLPKGLLKPDDLTHLGSAILQKHCQ